MDPGCGPPEVLHNKNQRLALDAQQPTLIVHISS
jgi:hypothetical protein